MKRPSFQFYPSDWLRDTALRSCSIGARGLWIDMICFMHEGAPYGHLKVGDKVILPANLARMVGETLEHVEGWLAELRQANVFDVESDGTMVSRRMIRDEAVRVARANGGKLGGNPMLLSGKVNLPGNHEVIRKDKQKTTPSSSSSSSSSSSEPSVLVPQGGAPDCPAAEIVDLYHDCCPTLPRCMVLSPKRQGLIRQRWREVWADLKFDKVGMLGWFREFFENVQRSDFLTGRAKSDRLWTADLEWLMLPSNFVKVAEGRYSKER